MSLKESFLSGEQISSFHENGYLVIEGFWGSESVECLRSSMANILTRFDFDDKESGAIFKTDDQQRTSNAYFLGSGDKVRFFWEEKAWEDDKLTKPPIEAINKVGHALHDMDPAFMAKMAEEIPNAELNICPDAGHLTQYDNPDCYFTGMIDFIESVDEGETE